MSFIPLINPQWCDDVPHVKYGNCSPMPIDTKTPSNQSCLSEDVFLLGCYRACSFVSGFRKKEKLTLP